MLTVIGVLLILFSCTALAMQKIAREKEKTETARAFRRVFSYLAEGVEYTRSPLPSLLSQAAAEDFGEAEEFLWELVKGLSDGSKRTLEEVWRMSLRTYADKHHLTPCMRRILKNLGSGLGQLAAKAEIENLNCACRELDEEILRGEKEFSENAKLIRSSGVLLGILIVILFL